MPVPIMPIKDQKKETSNGMDYSFLFNTPVESKKKVFASDKDASMLFELWSKGLKTGKEDAVKVPEGISLSAQDILRLKTLGFIAGDNSVVTFTKKGKTVITTMSLGETSQFDKKRRQKSYTEILASMDKRGKPGFRAASCDPKFSSNNSNSLDLSE